jgi:hypothetical protein
MPPAGFYKIVDIEAGSLYVQSTENPRYEQAYSAKNFAKNFQLASEKYQDDVELISALDIIGLL